MSKKSDFFTMAQMANEDKDIRMTPHFVSANLAKGVGHVVMGVDPAVIHDLMGDKYVCALYIIKHDVFTATINRSPEEFANAMQEIVKHYGCSIILNEDTGKLEKSNPDDYVYLRRGMLIKRGDEMCVDGNNWLYCNGSIGQYVGLWPVRRPLPQTNFTNYLVMCGQATVLPGSEILVDGAWVPADDSFIGNEAMDEIFRLKRVN